MTSTNTPFEMDEELKQDLKIIQSHSKEQIIDFSNDIMNGFYEVLDTILGNKDIWWSGTDAESIQKVINALAISASNVITNSHSLITSSYNSVFDELLTTLEKYQEDINIYNQKLNELDNARQRYFGLLEAQNRINEEGTL